jgi:PAS domain S-box-containing protein
MVDGESEGEVPLERYLRLGRRDLSLLTQAIAEAAGSSGAEDVLFRVGRRWGSAEADTAGEGASAEERVRATLRKLPRLGLGTVTLDELRIDVPGADCRLVGHVLDPLEQARPGGLPGSSGATCGLTVGFITGVTAALTGLDVVCSPFGCPADCNHCGCSFEIRPALAEDPAPAEAEAPSGSARFFLTSMGRGFTESDISLSALLEHTSDAIILLGEDDVIRFWNRGAETLFQYPRDEVVGRRAGFILPPDLLESDELGRLRRQLAQGESIKNYVTRRIRRDGTELWVSLTRTVLYDSAGDAIGSTAVLRDITEQKRTEDELTQSRALAMVGELASKVAHEVKNPLAGVYAAIQLLDRHCDEADPRHEIFAEVQRNLRRLDRTIEELLNFARPAPPKPHPTDLESFVRDTIEALKRRPEVAVHHIDIDIAAGTIVDCDTHLLGQVIDNLVLNAGQAMADPGSIRISAQIEGERVQVEVRDSGPGIPDEHLASIFDPFVTTKARGTGLGLSIARKNVEVHGGELEVGDADRGAVFTFSLPRAVDSMAG